MCSKDEMIVLMKFWIRIWKTNPLDGRKRNINARKMKRRGMPFRWWCLSIVVSVSLLLKKISSFASFVQFGLVADCGMKLFLRAQSLQL